MASTSNHLNFNLPSPPLKVFGITSDGQHHSTLSTFEPCQVLLALKLIKYYDMSSTCQQHLTVSHPPSSFEPTWP
ncbi:hypothetical protein BU26DRAFT_568239 [Trematosphaeria pertusa]|uniref:Uncharacterized protein n=1 Tax=Trematosphaeria pertusa TaxID=390896 RepID=A0A6A6I6V5_9PLEO|nr:uncharacterized protein BU26DRAFT_568239 [Trematosphaeria pertusa]KAF2245682.1 hypothetical protein BU26DRAFT_568239 [Trematosphaeria pertusa]